MCMQKFSHQHFGLCILAFDAAHVVAAGFFGVDVCHFVKVGIALSFALMQKKQKIKENLIAPRIFPGQRAAKAFISYLSLSEVLIYYIVFGRTFLSWSPFA